jgi:hypothetical protein
MALIDVLKILSIFFATSGYRSTRSVPLRRSSAAVSIAARCALSSSAATTTSIDGCSTSGRKHAALLHDHQNPLEPDGETARRHFASEEHADQVVVAPAAGDASRHVP